MDGHEVNLIGDLWSADISGMVTVGDVGDVVPVDVVDPVTIVGDPPPKITGWPPPVPLRADNWRDTNQGLRYMLIMGDTLSGMAATYLGAPTRWREIWELQTALRSTGRSPDKLFEGELLVMPEEAIQLARDTGLIDELPSERERVEKEKKIPTAVLVGGAVVGTAVLAGGIWYLAG